MPKLDIEGIRKVRSKGRTYYYAWHERDEVRLGEGWQPREDGEQLRLPGPTREAAA